MGKYTDKQFLETELKMGVSLDNPEYVELCKKTIESIEDLNFFFIVDYGSGVGGYTKAAKDKGYWVYPYDIFKAHRDYLKSKVPGIVFPRKLNECDLLMFIETAEHMTDNEIHVVITSTKPRYILFSSTPHKSEIDEEWGHINIKQDNEWDIFFAKYGYTKLRNNDFPTPWAKIYINEKG